MAPAFVTGTVIPGWSEGPDPESRDSGFTLRVPRNDGVKFSLRLPLRRGIGLDADCCDYNLVALAIF
jgi:hypothetical protein